MCAGSGRILTSVVNREHSVVVGNRLIRKMDSAAAKESHVAIRSLPISVKCTRFDDGSVVSTDRMLRPRDKYKRGLANHAWLRSAFLYCLADCVTVSFWSRFFLANYFSR